MSEEVFWELIGMLDGVVDDDGAELLRDRLTSLTPEEVESFCGHLAGKIASLAALPLEGLGVPDATDEGAAPLPLTADTHENLLYAVVASGRTRYAAVLAGPASVAAQDDVWDAGEAEMLVDAVAAALWDVSGLDWFEDFDPLTGPADDGRWYDTRRGSAWRGVPRRYESAVNALDRALNDSAEWRAWWNQTALRKISVSVTVNCDRSREQVERGKTIARARFEIGRSYFGDRDAASLEALAAEEAARVMHVIAEALDMTPPPPLPVLAR